MSTPTNKDLLKQIADQQLSTATQLSSFMNSTKDYIAKQNSFNERIAGYLENDDKTNQVGVVQKQQEMDKRLSNLETYKKIVVGISSFLICLTAWITNLLK
jgi:adenosyl cobinamide kinase/adenosyl cobinamide phosphate guanylyltransferase